MTPLDCGREPELTGKHVVGPGEILIDAIADAVARKLERMASNQQRLLEIGDAARYLGMTVHALRHKAGTEVPIVQIDKKLRFDRRELDRYIDRAKREGV